MTSPPTWRGPPRARVSADRWFSNAAGSSSRRRTGPRPASLHGRSEAAEPACLRPRTTRHATRLQPTFCTLVLLLLALLAPVRAQIYAPPAMPEALELRDILVDPRYAPVPMARDNLRPRRELVPRNAEKADETDAASSAAPTKTASKGSDSTARFQPTSATAFASGTGATASATGGIVAETEAPTARMPQPFDTSLGNNFTNPSCPQFFKSFLDDPTFKSCVPLSLLIMNSQSFFEAQGDPTTLRRVLDATCAAVSANCANVMSTFATAIADAANCGADLAAQNPIVQRAQAGFQAYAPLYSAGCLKADAAVVSAKTPSEYCFAAASGDRAQPADAYLYYLALGVALPGAARPACSSCTQRTMQIFAQAAGNLSSPLAKTYVDAATQINSKCGPGWVNATVTPIEGSAPSASAAATVVRVGALGWVALGAAAVALL